MRADRSFRNSKAEDDGAVKIKNSMADKKNFLVRHVFFCNNIENYEKSKNYFRPIFLSMVSMYAHQSKRLKK